MRTHAHTLPAAMTLPHNTSSDTTLCGYDIPANTIVYMNLYSAHYDASAWSEPGDFRPERFLNDKDDDGGGGGVVSKPDAFMLFMIGKKLGQ